MRLIAALLSVLALAGVVAAGDDGARTEARSPGCAAYVAYLRQARDDLARGDRAAATAALKRARSALRECRGDGEEMVVGTA
jgi:hypothetical protein